MLSEILKGAGMIQLTDIVIVANVIIAIFVAINEYRRRKAQNKADEGGAISSIANAAARVSESSVALVKAHESEVTELKIQIVGLKEEIRYYKKLLRDNNIPYTNFDSRPLKPLSQDKK